MNNNTLSTFERKIIWLSKGWHEDNVSREEAITSLFKKEYDWCKDKIYYPVIYNKLVKLVFKVCSQNEMIEFFQTLFDKQHLMTGDFSLMYQDNITLKNLVKMLISQISTITINGYDTVLIDIELPKDDPMNDFINKKKEETEKANAEFLEKCNKK